MASLIDGIRSLVDKGTQAKEAYQTYSDLSGDEDFVASLKESVRNANRVMDEMLARPEGGKRSNLEEVLTLVRDINNRSLIRYVVLSLIGVILLVILVLTILSYRRVGRVAANAKAS